MALKETESNMETPGDEGSSNGLHAKDNPLPPHAAAQEIFSNACHMARSFRSQTTVDVDANGEAKYRIGDRQPTPIIGSIPEPSNGTTIFEGVPSTEQSRPPTKSEITAAREKRKAERREGKNPPPPDSKKEKLKRRQTNVSLHTGSLRRGNSGWYWDGVYHPPKENNKRRPKNKKNK